jgi:hypothetical protein
MLATLAQSLVPQLFAASLPPYLLFLFFLHNSGKTPRLSLFGFYFLLVFVGATIPAGIYGAPCNRRTADWLCRLICWFMRGCLHQMSC